MVFAPGAGNDWLGSIYGKIKDCQVIFSAAFRSFLDISINTKYFSSLLISNLPGSAVLAVLK